MKLVYLYSALINVLQRNAGGGAACGDGRTVSYNVTGKRGVGKYVSAVNFVV